MKRSFGPALIGIGILLMFLGGTLAKQGPDSFLLATAATFGGWALMILGCVNYMRWKGYSGWFALFGYLLLPGLVILACFPNRRKRAFRENDPGRIAALEEVDRGSGYRFVLTLVPLGVLAIGITSLVLSARSGIDVAQWQMVAPAGAGFRAMMPGTPRVEQNSQESSGGPVVMEKFTVEPKGKKEMYMIVAVRYPEEVGQQLGGAEKLLQLGRDDLVAACRGRLRSEKPVSSNGCHALELEVLPAAGASVKARVYATNNAIYEVAAHVPQFRLSSADVAKFLNSFELTTPPSEAPKRSGQ